jgi:hypothetical protein
MANGQLPGRVAATTIGQGKSYSDMMNEQLALIQKQKAANLDKRLAQEEKNRQFRTEQLQNIYDFDVSGLASGDVQVLADMQRQLAASLDPNSENSYSNSQQLVADTALINNAYNEMKRWADTGMSGRQAYQQGVLNPDRGDGTVFVGDEDTLSQKNNLWERGAFAEGSVRLEGPPGNRRLVGMALDVDGNEVGEIGFFENSMRNQPDQFWRPEVVEAAYMDVAGTYADNTNVDITNVSQRAANDWDNNPKKIQDRYRRDKARREGLSMDDITNDNTTFQDGYTDEELRAEYIAEAKSGVENLRKQQTQDPLFDPQRTTSGLTNLKEKITLNVEDEEFAGNIIAADYVRGLDLEELRDADGNIVIPIQVAYVGAGGVVRTQTIDPSNPAYQQFIQQMGESGINEMFDRAGYTITTADNAGDDNQQGGDDPAPQDLETADLEQQRLDILEGTGDNEGMRSIEQRAENAKQEAIDSASEEVGFFGRFSGSESKSDVEARPITDFMSPAEKLAYNQAQKDLAAIDAQLGGEPNETTQSADNQAPQNPAAQPIQTEAPEAAAAIENSNVEAPNPNTGEPVTVDASAPEKQQAALAAFGGIIPLETQEDEIQEYIQELFVNVAPSDSTWLWTGAQEDFESGKNSDPVPPWCAAWVADMILRADPDFDFSAVESPSYGQTEKQAGETNRVRAQHYQKIGEAVSKTGDQYDAQVGDVVIKKVGTQFHVGFFAGYDEDGNVLILGGNQADSLNITPYPSDQIVSVRRVDVAAIDKEDVEKISATINDGKVT